AHPLTQLYQSKSRSRQGGPHLAIVLIPLQSAGIAHLLGGRFLCKKSTYSRLHSSSALHPHLYRRKHKTQPLLLASDSKMQSHNTIGLPTQKAKEFAPSSRGPKAQPTKFPQSFSSAGSAVIPWNTSMANRTPSAQSFGASSSNPDSQPCAWTNPASAKAKAIALQLTSKRSWTATRRPSPRSRNIPSSTRIKSSSSA